jgi:glycosyltransferase involved in cell wall biosynthesis
MCVNTFPLVFAWPARLMCRPAPQLLATVNTYELPSRRDRLFMILYAFFLRRCDRIVFGCRRQADAWIDRYRLDRDKAIVVYNGVDTGYFSPGDQDAATLRDALGIVDSARVVGCVAQLRPEKQQKVLLQAAVQVRERLEVPLVVVLVGDGPEAAELKRFAVDRGLDRHVRFVGAVKDVRPYLAMFDAFVLPSASEVFSNAVLEAMAMRVPVIASDAGGSGEMIEHGEGGFLYPPGDVDQLGRLLYEVLTDTQLADRFREAAAARIRADFSLQRMEANYAETLWPGRE